MNRTILAALHALTCLSTPGPVIPITPTVQKIAPLRVGQTSSDGRAGARTTARQEAASTPTTHRRGSP